MAIIEEKLSHLGIILPPYNKPMANYVSVQKTGRLLYLSGNGPVVEGKVLFKGKIGKELTLEDGYAASRITAINLISTLKNYLGDLDKIEQIISVHGFVASDAEFFDQPYVINGASDLLVKVFGEAGKHTRSAIGTNVLPFNTPVEIEMIVQIKES